MVNSITVIKMKKTKIFFGILSAIFVLMALIVFITERYSNYSFLIGTVNGDTLIVAFGVCTAICILISAITAIVYKTEKRIVINSVVRFVCICIIGFLTFISASSGKDYTYYEFTSPDGVYEVVAEEWSYLLGGGVNFYERINPMIVIYKECFHTDDGYRAISSGNYSVNWNENVMSFKAQNGNNIYKTVNIVV